MAAVDYFLKFDGIKGESTDAKHKDEIDVESWSWGETHAGAGAPGAAAGAGKVSMQDFHFVMGLNRASIESHEGLRDGAAHQDGHALGPQGRQGPAGVPDVQVPRRPRQLVPDGRIRGSRRARPIRCRSTSRRSRSSTSRRRRTAPWGRRPRVQVRPEGEQDLLARLDRRPAVEPVRAEPASRAPRPAARGDAAARRSSSPGCCETPATRRTASRSGSRPATSSSRARPSCRRTCDGSATRTSWPCLLRLFVLGVPVARARFDELVGAELRERLAGAGLLVAGRRGRPRGGAPRPSRRAADRLGSCGRRRSARRPRAGRASSVRRARPPDRSRRGRACARPLHRQRDPGDPARRARRARGRDGRERAGARLRGVQRGAQRRRQRRDAGRQLLRAGRGRAVRPRRRQPAVRRLAREHVSVPRRRHVRGRCLRARRASTAPPRSRPARSPAS